MKRILLWDIDGTLLTMRGLGRDASNKAFQQLYGQGKIVYGREMAGKTDLQILAMFLNRNKIPYDDLLKESMRVKNLYSQLLHEQLKNTELPLLYPNGKNILENYHNKKDYVNALLTGNYKITAKLKLDYFQLWEYFEFGAFGDFTTNREELIPVALDEFATLYKEEIDASHIFVIGDTPNDINICKPYSLQSIAVATGHYSMEDLKKYNPTFLVNNLLEFPKI